MRRCRRRARRRRTGSRDGSRGYRSATVRFEVASADAARDFVLQLGMSRRRAEKVWDVALADLAAWLGGELSQRARVRMIGSSLARSVTILHDDRYPSRPFR